MDLEPSNGDVDSARLAALRLLARQPELSQRELSHALGVSLGKTHYVLHALLDQACSRCGTFDAATRRSHMPTS